MNFKQILFPCILLLMLYSFFNAKQIQALIKTDIDLASIAIMAKAFDGEAPIDEEDPIDGGELPPVEVICGANGGNCWMETDFEREWTPFGGFVCTSVCGFTGVQSDFCEEGLPTPC